MFGKCPECGQDPKHHLEECSQTTFDIMSALLDDREIHILTKADALSWSVTMDVKGWRNTVHATGPAINLADARRRLSIALWRMLTDYLATPTVDPESYASAYGHSVMSGGILGAIPPIRQR